MTITDTTATPAAEPVACSIFLALDAGGSFVATEDGDQIADIAVDLEPGYRIIEVIVTARPPVAGVADVEVADDADAVVADIDAAEIDSDAPEAA